MSATSPFSRASTRRLVRTLLVSLAAALLACAVQAQEAATDASLTAGNNLVANGDFAADLAGWAFVDPAAFWNANDASSNVQSGSLGVNESPPTDLVEISAASQCIALPAPGSYELTGKGNAGALPAFAQDPLKLRWAYRAAAAGCAGVPTLSGELFIPGGSGWRAPAGPLVLTVPPADWSAATTLEIELVVERNANDPETSGITGRFDDVSLRLRDDVILATGFE